MSLNICSIFLLDFRFATFLKTADGDKDAEMSISSWAVLGQPAGPRPRPERFEVLTKHLVRLGDIAWQQGIGAIKEACKILEISYKESDVLAICSEVSGNTFETQAEPLEVSVCDFLAYLLHSTPSQQDFEILNSTESATAIHRVDERGLFLKYYESLLNFVQGASCNGVDVWYDAQRHLPSIPLEEVNIFQVNHWIIEPLTSKEDFSYTEVVTNDSCKKPKQLWFISHWWGEAMTTFVQCLAKHLDIRHMPVNRTAYWTAWAALGPGERRGQLNGPLPTAQALAQRKVLLLLNPQGEAFRRTWCVLEMAVATGLGEARKDPHTPKKVGVLDLVTMRPGDGRASLPVVLTDGLTEMEQEWETKHPGMGYIGKTDREKRFPLEVLSGGLLLDFAQTETSVAEERTWVTNFLSKLTMIDEPATPENVSQHLRSFFAATAVVQALKRQQSVAPYMSIIAGNVAQQELKLPCLAHVLEDPEVFLSELSSALAKLNQLKVVKLDLGWRSLYANGHVAHLLSAASLAQGLENLQILQDFTLRLNGCRTLHLFGCAHVLPRSLQRLELRFDGCERLKDATELVRCLGDLQQLTFLQLQLSGCKGLLQDSDLVVLGKSLRQLQQLQHLSLDLSGAKRLFYLIELGRNIRFLSLLQEFHLDLSLCINLSDISHLGNSLRILLAEPCGSGFRSEEESPGSFSLKLDKSGVRINREKVVGYDNATAFVKALGVRALWDPEDDVGPPVEKERPCVWLTHMQEMAIKRSFKVPMGCQGMHKGCPRLY